jgi:uncharacterized SAM-binding protein YcdF (DUF218 family)
VSDDVWAQGAATGEVPAEPAPADEPTPVGGVAVVRRRRWGRRLAWVAGGLVVAAVLYYGVTLYQVHATGQSDHTGPADAIVVMGAAQYDGTPSPLLQARLDHALELWQLGYAPLVVVTGGNQPGDRFTEASASQRYLVAQGVPADSILEEDRSHSSFGSLDAVAQMLHDRGLQRVLLVSDPFHSLRIKLSAEELGLDAAVSPTRTSPVRGAAAFRREMKETAGVAVGRIIGFRRLLSLTG